MKIAESLSQRILGVAGTVLAVAALAISCASRHIGIAMLAASTVPGPRTIALVIAYTIASAAVSIPYLKWRGRTAGAVSRQ